MDGNSIPLGPGGREVPIGIPGWVAWIPSEREAVHAKRAEPSARLSATTVRALTRKIRELEAAEAEADQRAALWKS
ncbi:hypothetical protein [Streptosporangium canum]|uniref:hypothetical protein n=1 Tax=Streptosporangium canum TaxID=324952 RepID=UPI0011604056|nr:hypothetical protein [Streptosporangium canum]